MQASEFLFCIVMILLIIYIIVKLFLLQLKFTIWIAKRIVEKESKE